MYFFLFLVLYGENNVIFLVNMGIKVYSKKVTAESTGFF